SHVWSAPCMLLLSCFFDCGARPSFPSFPTRRSSDLVNLYLQHFSGTPIYVAVRKGRVQIIPGADGCDFGNRFDLCIHHIDWAAIDRKSTRLNSSHVKISYAVFCLKKKKNQKPISRTE